MNELFIIGLLWEIGGVLTVQAATVSLLRIAQRRPPTETKSTVDLDADGRMALLTAKHERQTETIDRLQQRLAVMERIATDPADRTARAIDALR